MKKFLAIFIVTAMSITIVGCGGKTDTEDDTKAPVENSSESTSEIGEEGAGETTTSQVADNETTGNGESNEETTTSEQVTTEKPTPEPTPTPTLTPEPHMHSYTESVTKEATCTGKGIKTFSCNCGNSYTEVIKATGHNYEVVADSKVFATCTNSGKESDTKCSFCGDVIEGKVIPKISHSYGEYVYNNDASTEKDGTETATCGNCGNKDTRTVAGTRIEICPYKLYTIAYDNQGYPYFYGKWGGSANMDADNWAKTEACIDEMGEYMCEHYTIWREDYGAYGVSFDYSWQLIGRYEGMEIVVRYVESCNNIFLDSLEARGIPTAGNGVWYED